jgi:ABC-2 type transport system permease protein
MSRLAASWHSFKTAAWLGWQIESNWADPFLFAIYSFVKPLSSAGILVVMYALISGGNFGTPIFAYIYIGMAFYIYVGSIMTGVSWAIIDDREHYRTLKYIYIAPVRVPYYLLGRGMARFLIGSISVLITLTFGVLFLKIPIVLSSINWPLFLVVFVTGILLLAMMGVLLGGITLMMANHSFLVGDTVASALYLFSGAIFPLEVLPAWIRPLGYIMPITYWLELLRRSLVGSISQSFPTFAVLSDAQLLGILFGLTIVFGCAALLTFQLCERWAREHSRLDSTSNY